MANVETNKASIATDVAGGFLALLLVVILV